MTRRLEDFIREHAASTPDKVSVIYKNYSTTYAQLWAQVSDKREHLKKQGLGDGCLFVLKASPDPNFIVTYLAVHCAGAVAVPLEKDMPDDRFQAFTTRLSDTKTEAPTDNPSEAIADVLFTTGSTGAQKGVMISHRALLADADNLVQAQGFTEKTVFVICGPLNHFGSLSKLWPTFIKGGTIILLDGMKDQSAFFHAFDYPGNKFATFLVPASIRLLLLSGKEPLGRLADKIDFIETGGAALSQTDMDTLCSLLPHSRLYNTYASTETGIVSTYDFNHQPPLAGCVGQPMSHSSFFITPDNTIACKGETLMSGYLNDPALTAAVFHDDTVFTTDLGAIDKDGNLHILGRNNDVINIGGYKVSPEEVENAALACPEISDCICFPTQSPLFGETIKLLYVVKEGMDLGKRELARFMATRLENYKVPRIFEEANAIRHTFNGKLDRTYYARL